MSQTVTVPAKTIDEIFSRLDELTKAVKKISAILLKGDFSYGSDEWWDKEIKEGLEEVKKGKVKKFKTMTETIRYLNS